MNELIALNQSAINGEFQQTVNARELHAFLESKQDFSTWIKNRIEKYGFVENQDFCSFHKIMERAIGGTVRNEYHLTIGMAKEVAMIEKDRKSVV